MKNKTIAFNIIFNIFLVSTGFKIDSHQSASKSDNDLKKVLQLDINNNSLTNGMSIYNFDIYHDILYVVKKHDLIQVSLKTGKISKNLEVSGFLNKLKVNVGIGKIVVKDNGYYLSCLNDIYFISNSGKVNKIYDNKSIILDFSIVENKIIIASRDNHIKLINENGISIFNLPFELVDAEYILSNNGLCYSSAPQDYVYEFKINKNHQLFVEKSAPIFLTKEIKDPDIAFVNDKYFVAFSYYQRNNLYIINKSNTRNQILKTINLGQNNIQPGIMDEGKPDFRVAIRENVNYLVTINNKKLNVFTFNF